MVLKTTLQYYVYWSFTNKDSIFAEDLGHIKLGIVKLKQ